MAEDSPASSNNSNKSPTPMSPTHPTKQSTNPKLHHALAISNIHIHVPVTLEMEKVLYSTWAELFKIHCRSSKVVHHILPCTCSETPDSYNEDWDTLDAILGINFRIIFRNGSSYGHAWSNTPQPNSPWNGSQPPCPYPSSNWTRNSAPSAQRFNLPPRAGLLGPIPQNASWEPTIDQHAYSATDIAQAMHTLDLNPPDTDWYMDTGVTSHIRYSSLLF
ncbi:hypothetical protein LIER_39704 [Lithospermum erythrorhizon]|uniref:Uncharacterized protein n=1 Tax=Lithospermum erythrorhizon TaxID=34254 RepID=A0AAV3QJU4_LITER